MGTFSSPKVESGMKVEDLANLVAMLIEDLEYLLNGQIDAKNVRAKSITAERLKVDELSAISANLGKVVAGILIGAYISTADGTYPRIDFSSSQNLLKAMLNATNYISINPNLTGSPTFLFDNGTIQATVSNILNAFVITTLSFSDIQINALRNLYLNAGPGYKIRINAWSDMLNVSTNRTLQQDLDFQQAQINNLLIRVAYLESRLT